MTTTKKKPKPAVCTRYAVLLEDGDWISDSGVLNARYTFDQAGLYPTRKEAREDAQWYPGSKIVPVRCRALTSVKKNVKRTR